MHGRRGAEALRNGANVPVALACAVKRKGCDRGMSASGFQLSPLHDSRLAPLATSALPAWLWSTDGSHVVWANAAGAAALGAPDCAAIGARRFDTRQPEGNQIARLAATLLSGASPRLERLQGFGADAGRTLI